MRINSETKDIPSRWYNIIPDLDFQVPTPISSNGYPITYNDMEQLSSSAIINQELERKVREISIPKEIMAFYSNWRPTPLYRAENLEKMLGTSARLYYKDEGSNSSGGHEMNTALPQAYYASKEKGVKCIVTATGNGEWGAALAIACNYFGLKCKVFMVRSSYEQKPYGRYIMEILGADVIPSPSSTTKFGQKEIAENPNSQGSIGLALSEAFEDAASHDDTKFAWGSVMNHVLLHQTVVGLEAQNQLRRIGVSPDIIISAVGGGSSFGGLVFPFYPDRGKNTRMVAVESASAPSLSKGQYTYDYSDAKGLTFLLKMYTLGHGFVPPGIRAGNMRYHGVSPLISALYREQKIEAKSYRQHQAFEAAISFARAEGMIPSPESAYAIKAAMDEALSCKDKNESKNILFVVDANSNLDLETFRDFVDGSLETMPSPEKEIQEALTNCPAIPAQ
jgi:tryptophan synthase beta chain